MKNQETVFNSSVIFYENYVPRQYKYLFVLPIQWFGKILNSFAVVFAYYTLKIDDLRSQGREMYNKPQNK